MKTLTQEGIGDHVRNRSNTVPALPLQRECRKINRPLTLPKVAYAQILLEEEDDLCSETEDEIVLKRVLIWRPGLRKRSHLQGYPTTAAAQEHPPSVDTASHERKRHSVRDDGNMQPRENTPSGLAGSTEPSSITLKPDTPSGIEMGRTNRPTGRDDNQTTTGQRDRPSHVTSKSSLKVCRTNLTDTLPPFNERHKSKVRTHSTVINSFFP